MTDEERTKLNYDRWKKGLPREPANPYADPNSPESQAIRDGNAHNLKPQSTTLDLRKECRDGGKGRKEDNEMRGIGFKGEDEI